MMDNPHDYLISSPAPPRQVHPDNAHSWVMLNESGFVKLGNERILLRLDSRISCDLSVPQELRATGAQFHRKSDKGSLFLTNKRVCTILGRCNGTTQLSNCSLPDCLLARQSDTGAKIRVIQRPDSQISRLDNIFIYVVGLGLEVRLHPSIRWRHTARPSSS